MRLAAVRARYLAAMGLSTAAAVGSCTPNLRRVEVGQGVYELDMPRSRSDLPTCPSGEFCTPEPATAPAGAAPAPYAACPATTAYPRPTDPSRERYQITFGHDRTTRERAVRPGVCCYHWVEPCPGGRPLRASDASAVVAPPCARDDWRHPAVAVDPARAPAAARAALAAHWTREAAYEHASVASFARAALQLMALGAPPDLLAETHEAASDEIAHARIAYAIASTYAGADVGPGPLPVTAIGWTTGDAASFAREVLLDACVNESVAAVAARAASAGAVDPAVAGALARIADDEERHAALAWKTLAWLLRAGSADVLAEVRAALRGLTDAAAPAAPEAEGRELDLAGHGVLPASESAALRRRVLCEIVLPCAHALIQRTVHTGASSSVFAPVAEVRP